MATKNVCSECIKHSGGCCVSVRFNVHVREVQPFLEAQKNGKISDKQKLVQDKSDKAQYLYDSGDERCVFLNDFNSCSIYDKRPLICRMYPILWKKDNHFVDLICPLVHLVPLREIATWPDKNKESLVFMDELEFDGRSRQYINLKTLNSMNDALIILKDPDVGF